jgi:type VI secretion system secreted protein VgrG
MPQLVKIDINIDGNSIKQFSSLALTQGIFEHHEFRLVCPSEAIDKSKGLIFNKSKDLIGGKFSLQIDAVGSDAGLKFTGVVTQVEAERYSGHAGDVIISGFSPTALMDNGPHCKTWEKKTIKDIAEEVFGYFPQNLLQPDVDPSYGDLLSYTVQYKETAWQFLSRLSATYGEWLYYDGQQVVLGPPDGDKTTLTYGSNLSQFNMALQVVPTSFRMVGHDFINHEVYSGEPSGLAGKAGLSDLGKTVLQKGQQFYSANPKQWNNHFLTNKKQLDDYVDARAAMQSSNMVRFNGSADHPGVGIGGSITVQGRNVFSDAQESYGDFTVISIHHHCDGQGNYSNEFVSIPASLKMPPVHVYAEPRCETQSALVTDNYDQKGLGRVRVRFHWMAESEKSPWIRIASPHGGDSKGMFFIPEIGEEVIVGFEGDSPKKPFVIGTVYHGKAKTSFANSGNDVKALQTRSGNMIVMNDNDGSVHVADAKGNDILIDGSGNIKVTASEKIDLVCGDAEITMKKNGDILISGKQVNILASDKASMMSSQASVLVDGTQNEVDVAGMKVSVQGQQEVDVKGLQTSISADTTMDIKANAEINVQSSGMVAVKGAMITLN